MTVTSSMMMMMSCLVDHVCAEVANQSNSGLQHSSTFGAWVCRAGWGDGGRVKSRFASSTLFWASAILIVSACSGMNNTAPQGSILGTYFPVGDINVEACEGLLKGVLEAFLLPTNWSFAVAEFTIYKSCFGRRSSGIRVTWPAHLTWAFCSRVWMLGMPARVRTSVSGIMSCHLMLKIICKHFAWKWLSFLAWRLYTVHDSHAYSRTVSTTAMYTFSLVSWLISHRSHTSYLSLPNAELALESLLMTPTSM